MASSNTSRDADRTAALEPRDARRRRQLIDATITSIAENGLSGTTVAKVAKLAELSSGIVNFYFQSKDALLLATLRHVDLEFERRQNEAARLAGDDPVRLLDAMVEVEFDPEVCNPRWTAVWNAFWGEARAREDYRRVCGAREAAHERKVIDLFRGIARAGGHQHLHPKAMGRAFYHLLSSLGENVLSGHEPFDFDDAKSTCRSFLKSVFPEEFSDPAKFEWSEVTPLIAPESEPALRVPGVRAPRFETLPTWVYDDPEFFKLEIEHVFRRNWLLVGHVSEAPETGGYIALDVANDRVFVVRGNDGRFRAFHNVCRHRASRVVKGDVGSCRGSIVCPYHGWSYGFDGRLRGVPDERSYRGLEAEKISLPELELEVWMGFIFVRFLGEGPRVRDQMASFADEAGRYRFEDMKPWGSRSTADCEFNWKLFAENAAEGNDIAVRHPGLMRPLREGDSEDASLEGGGRRSLELSDEESSVWSQRMYQRILPEVESLPIVLRRSWVTYSQFPTVVMRAGPDGVDCYQVLPVGPEKCRIHGFRIAHEDSTREMRAARYLRDRILRRATAEDIDHCSWAHGGMRSAGYLGGSLSELESGVRRFQNRIRELIPVAKLPDRPPPGRVAQVNRDM